MLSGRIVRPLKQLHRDASALASGDFSHRTGVHTQDEVGVLADAFNSMAGSVQQRQHEAREATDTAEVRLDRSPAGGVRLRDPVDEQEVRDDAARKRAAHDDGEVGADRDERHDELGRVAEARVEEAADAGPGVLGGVLGRLADQPRERDQRRCGEDEERHVSRVEGEVDDKRDRSERERRPEELSRHADTLTRCRRRSRRT